MTSPFSIQLDETLNSRPKTAAEAQDELIARVASGPMANYPDDSDYKREELARGYAEAEKGKFISDKAVSDWVESWDTPDELPMPKPDIDMQL